MKRLIIQCDGLGDKTYKELEGKTPLEYAKTPYIDSIIEQSKLGMVTTIPDEYFCGSYYGNLALLGFNFSKRHMKFGSFCAKLNFEDYKDSEYAILCKIVSRKKEMYAIQDVTKDELEELCLSLNHLKCVKKYNLNFRLYDNKNIILFINKEDIKVNFSDISRIKGKDITDFEPKGKDKEIFMEIQEEIGNMLKNHKINKKRIQEKRLSIDLLLFSEGGYGYKFDNFKEWHGVEGTLIAGTKFLKTIGNLVGFKVICPKGATGGMNTDLHAKVKTAIEEIKYGNNFVFLHINATDKLSHDGDLYGKIEAIEKIDREVIKPIINELINSIENFKFMITTDHNTYCSTRSHEIGQVPFLIFDGIYNAINEKQHFCEKSCKIKNLNFKSGKKLFDYFVK